MRAVRRIARALWDGSTGRRAAAEALREDPAVADDGLIGFAVVATFVVGLTTFAILPTVLTPVLAPLTALLAAFVLRLVTRIARQQATLAETTAAITTTSLPLLLVPVPTIGPPIGITMWLLAGIFLLQRVTLARLDVAAVVTLLSHALTTGVLIGIGYAIEALI